MPQSGGDSREWAKNVHALILGYGAECADDG